MRKFLMPAFALFSFLFFLSQANGQSCVPTNLNGTVINLSCGTPCANLSFKVPHLKSTSAYTYNKITYDPLPFVVATGGTEDVALYDDDFYSSVFTLPFPFCFYDSTYSKAVVGSNGLITFDETNAGCYNAYPITGTIPGPGLGSDQPCVQSDEYYPKAAIMGLFTDLDPSSPPSPLATRKIQWRLEGTAPCRKFVVSYYDVGTYGRTGTNCNNTFQMILYESTGLIDVHIQNKNCQAGTSSGRGILGIQDWTRTKATVAPGKNATIWTSFKEGFRFTPSGGASKFISSELLSMTGTVLATADTLTTQAGILDLNFPNICPTVPTTKYVVRTTFGSCPNGTTMVSLDTITINKNTTLPVTTTLTPTGCGVNTGTATVNVTPGNGTAPFQFSIDGGALQTSNVFSNLSVGPHTVFATDATDCDTSFTITILALTTLDATATPTSTACPTASNGTITVAADGIAPHTFVLTGPGGPYTQTNPVFTGLAAGTYSLTFADNGGCSGSIASIVVTAGPAIGGSATTAPASCPLVADGTVTVIPDGTAPYTFVLTGPGGPYTQSSPIFTGTGAGNYSLTYTDNLGCTAAVTGIVVPAGPDITGSATTAPTSCPGVDDGTVTVTSTGGPGTVYTLNPGAISNTTGIFTGLAAGTYTVTFVATTGCAGALTTDPVVASGPAPTAAVTKVNPPCAGINDGTATIVPNSGPGSYSFTLSPGGVTNSTGVFTGLTADVAYNYTFTSAAGCIGSGTFTLTTNTAVVTPVVLTMPLCYNTATGTARFNPSGGVGPYQYSADAGVTYQASNLFNGLTQGSHTFRIKDNVGCIKDTTVMFTQPTLLTSSATSNATAGCSNDDGAITVTGNGGTAPYAYKIAGPQANTTGQTTGAFTGLPTGDYVATVTDAKGCTSAANVHVGLIDNMFLEVGADTTICAETTITFNPQTNAGTSVFAWRTDNSAIGLISHPDVKNASATPTDTSRYILHATWGTCEREDTILVRVLHKPVPDAGQDTSICNLTYAILRGSASDLSGTVNYAWSPVTGITSPTDATTQVYPAGNDTTYSYTLTVTDNYGCDFSVTDEVNVRVQPPVPAFAGNDTTAVQGAPHQLFGSGGAEYLWSPATYLNSAFVRDPLATLQNDSKFILKVTDVAGCIGFDTVFVKVYEGPAYYIPNAFTPNGDGLNDVFRAIPVGIASTQYFRIFNRLGEMVFETNQWLKGWDGTFRGKKQPMGVYVWIIKGIDRKGKNVEMKGTVMLAH